jgi:hypothetical protein
MNNSATVTILILALLGGLLIGGFAMSNIGGAPLDSARAYCRGFAEGIVMQNAISSEMDPRRYLQEEVDSVEEQCKKLIGSPPWEVTPWRGPLGAGDG